MLNIIHRDALTSLKKLDNESVHMCVTSPPYWGLRDYGTATWEGGDAECDHASGRFTRGGLSGKQASNTGSGGDEAVSECPKCGAMRIDKQLGLEKTPEEYVAKLVAVFAEVKRVLRNDGTLWLNVGDSYSSGGRLSTTVQSLRGNCSEEARRSTNTRPPVIDGIKPKDLVGIPWMVAFALRADGWYLRSDIIWAKPNPMPESVTDRPTKSHEYIFLLTKSERYFFDADAVRETLSEATVERDRSLRGRSQNGGGSKESMAGYDYSRDGLGDMQSNPSGRNIRSVWAIPTQPFADAHFAVFPKNLVSRCIRAGTSERGCCAECGAPWERVTERERFGKQDYDGKYFNADDPNSAGRNMLASTRASRAAGMPHDQPFPTARTVGWQPTCKHNAETVPCTVLDPFAGSGTTGEVAIGLGRAATLIELNEKYVQMIKKRCTTTIGLPFASFEPTIEEGPF